MKLSKLYIDPELQFPMILSLMVLVTIEGLFIAWGFYAMQHWEGQGRVLEFFTVMLLTAFLIVSVNFVIGAFLSHKIAEPLEKMHNAMHEVARGNLEMADMPVSGSLLKSHTVQFNEMVERLRHLIYRDQRYSQEINDMLTRCQNLVEGKKELTSEEQKELQKLIKDAKSKLSIIDSFFMRGRQERA